MKYCILIRCVGHRMDNWSIIWGFFTNIQTNRYVFNQQSSIVSLTETNNDLNRNVIYLLHNELWCQSRRGMWHFVDRKSDGVQRSGSFGFRISFILLHDGHDHMAFVARSSGYAYVELRVHGRCFRISRTTAGVVSAPPSSSCEHGPPRLFRVQCRFGHPVIRTDMDDIQLREMPGEVFERHPVQAKIPLTKCIRHCVHCSPIGIK